MPSTPHTGTGVPCRIPRGSPLRRAERAGWRERSAGLLLAVALLAMACTGGDDSRAAPEGPSSPEEVAAARLRLSGRPIGAQPKPDFVLTDTQGGAFDFREATAGYVTLLYFGYTNCPDICPVHFANIAEALRKVPLEVRSRVRVVFVGVDAGRDTPERVREWLNHFDQSFVGLTGTPAELEAAQQAAAVPPAFVDEEWEGGYSVSHAGWVMLFVPEDRALLLYPSGTRQREWAHDLEALVMQGWPTT